MSELVGTAAAGATGWRPFALWATARAPLTVVSLLAAINLAVFHAHWVGTASFNFDFPMTYYASTAYWIASVQSHEWPQWMPFQSMGYPFAMNLQTGIYYPPLWLFVLFGQEYTLHAANIVQALHVLVGSLGMFLLARRLSAHNVAAAAGAVAYHLFGGFFTNAEHPDIVRAFALTPWVLWSVWLDAEPRHWRVWTWRFESRLAPRNLALPPLLYCFITGAYMGNVIAGMFLFAVFVLAQAVSERRRAAVRLRDAALLLGAMAIAVAMAAVFLLPATALQGELTRSSSYVEQIRWYLRLVDLWGLLFPAALLVTSDYSMIGMDVSIVLLACIVLVRKHAIAPLRPLLVIAAIALFMCVGELEPISRVVIGLVSPLAMSRFPAGDYRVYLVITTVVVAVLGLREMLVERSPSWRTERTVRYALAVGVVACAGAWCAAKVVPAERAELFAVTALAALACAVAVIVLSLAAPRDWLRPTGVLTFVLVAALPGAYASRVFWFAPGLEAGLYDARGLPLTERGRLRTYGIFRAVHRERPPRKVAPHRHLLSWEGYIDGAFMTEDVGGTVARARATVEAHSDLAGFMLEGTRLVAVPCRHLACESANARGIDIKAPPPDGFAFRGLRYGRNDIEYSVGAPEPLLLVENELHARGWSGVSNGRDPVKLVRVNDALRGWVIPAGSHHLHLTYRTPLLSQGLSLSAAAWLGYAGLLLFVRRSDVGRFEI